MTYVDGFLVPIPKKSFAEYKNISTKAGKVWKEYGALDYKECVIEDPNCLGMTSFKSTAKAKANETVVFAYIVYKSKNHRDQVNAKAMKDPRIAGSCDPKKMPFDVKRMAYGGFKVFVDPK